jgi:phosphoribosylamine--glycine ligase
LPALQAACDGELQNFDLRWHDTAAVGVVMATRGYPDAPERGSLIKGLDAAAAQPGVTVFHAGTSRDAEGNIIATGGRVLTIVATAPSVQGARLRAYAGVGALQWPEGFCRRDIGERAT